MCMCVYWLHLLLYFKSLELKLLKFPLGYLFIVAEQCVCACACVCVCVWEWQQQQHSYAFEMYVFWCYVCMTLVCVGLWCEDQSPPAGQLLGLYILFDPLVGKVETSQSTSCVLSHLHTGIAFYKHVISTFPYHLIFHAFHLLYKTFYPLSFLLCAEKDCINTSLPEIPEFHYEPLTHVTSDLIRQISSR